jgi:MFS family permease
MNENSKKYILGIIICLVGALFYCYEFVLRIVPGILQTEISKDFGNISATTFGQLSALYYFAYSPMQLPVGILMDRFGPRILLTLACLSCTIGSLMFSYSTSLAIAGGGRFLIGFGSSFAFVGVLSCAIAWLPYRYFSLVAGLMTTIGMLGLVFGEIKITELSKHTRLEDILFMLVIIGIIMTVTIFFVIRNSKEPKASTQLPMYAFLKDVIHALKTPQIWIIGIIAAFLYTSLSVFGELWGKSYLEKAHNLSKSEAANTISWMFLGWAVGAPLCGYLSDKYKHRIIPLLVGAIFSLIFISIILYVPNISHFHLNTFIFLYGVFSASEIVAFIMANEFIKKAMPGTIFAIINLIVTIGGAIFQPLVGKLLDLFSDNTLINQVHIYSIKDYRSAMSILPFTLIITIFLLIYLQSKSHDDGGRN